MARPNEEQRALRVDPDEITNAVVIGLDVGHVIMVGPPGTGKTTAGIEAAERRGTPYRVFCWDDGGTVGQYCWTRRVENGTDRFSTGPLYEAATKGETVIINEFWNGSRELKQRLLMVLDPGVGGQDSLPDGTVIKIHPDFRVIMTSNERLSTFPKNVLSRVRGGKLIVDMPPSAALDPLPREVAELCRRSYTEASVSQKSDPQFDLRDCQSFAMLRKAFGDDDRRAAIQCFGDPQKVGAFIEALTAVRLSMDDTHRDGINNLVSAIAIGCTLDAMRDGMLHVVNAIRKVRYAQLQDELSKDI